MAKRFACRDDGEFPDCPAIMRGETEEEVILQAKAHGRQAHGMTEDQLRDPALVDSIRSHVRDM